MTEDAMELRFRVFAVLWSTALCFDLANNGMSDTWPHAALSLLCLGVWLKPGSRLLFGALVAGYFASVWDIYPGRIWVHRYFNATVCLTLVVSILGAMAWQRTPRVAAADWLRAASPPLRVILLIAVGFAGFAKLNDSFLDPESSCATALYLLQSGVYGLHHIMPDAPWAHYVAIGLTLVGELLVPVGLLSRGTRPAAILVGSLLFFLLGINPVSNLYEFVTPILALLFLFTDDHFVLRVRDRLRKWGLGRLGAPSRLVLSVLGSAVCLLLIIGLDELPERELRRQVCRVAFDLGALGGVVAYAASLLPWSLRPTLGQLARGGSVPGFMVAAVMFLNECAPYAGMYHQQTFTMAAGLSIVRGRSNHIIVREPPLHRASRGVVIRGSSDPWLQRVKRADQRLNWFTFRFHLAHHPEARVWFEVEGEERMIERAGRGRTKPVLGSWLAGVVSPPGKCGHWTHVAEEGPPHRRTESVQH